MQERKKNTVKRIFDLEASKYALPESVGAKFVNSIELTRISKLIDSSMNSDSVALDIGTGPGRILKLLLGRSKNSIGVDISKKMLRENIRRRKSGNTFLALSEATHLPFKDEVFDFLIAVRVLKYVPNYEMFFKEVIRVVKKKGYLIIDIPNLTSYDLITKTFLSSAFNAGILKKSLEYFSIIHLFSVNNLLKSLSNVAKPTEIIPLFIIPEFFFLRARNSKELQILQMIETKANSTFLQKLAHRQLVKLQKI